MTRRIAEPAWLHPLMTEWADPVLHSIWARTGDVERAQFLTRQVFLRAAHQAGSETPALADLFQLADRLTPNGRVPAAPWESGTRRLSLRDRRACWLALYGRWSFRDLAAAENRSTSSLMAALARLAHVMGEGVPAEDEGAWRAWLSEHGPPPLPVGVRFRWGDWDPQAPLERTRIIRPRHVLMAAAVALMLGGWVWHTEAAAAAQRAAIPRLPFAEQPSTTMFHIIVARGVPVARHAFGSASATPVPAERLTDAFTRYDIATTSPGHPTRDYQVGSLHVAWARNQAGVGLIVSDPTGAPVTVVNLASGGTAVHGAVEPGYRVYGFTGLAGAVRVTEAGQSTVLAWAAGLNTGIESGAWSPVAGQRPPRGPDGSRVYAPPPGPGTALGVLADGVLWQTRTGWWLLPPNGAPLPMILPPGGPSAPQQIVSLWPPYPGVTNEVMAYENWQANGGGPASVWWNLATERMGVVSNSLPVLTVDAGWIEGGQTNAVRSYGSPPATLPLSQAFVTAGAWAQSLFIQSYATHSSVYGTYNWARRTWTPAPVQRQEVWGVVPFPEWGPTYVRPGGWAGINTGLALPGPMTVRLTPANGRTPTSFTVSVRQTFFAGTRWVAVASRLHPNLVRVGWPDAGGRLVWHGVQAPVGSVIHATTDFLYWTSAGHTYIWVPPFQPY